VTERFSPGGPSWTHDVRDEPAKTRVLVTTKLEFGVTPGTDQFRHWACVMVQLDSDLYNI